MTQELAAALLRDVPRYDASAVMWTLEDVEPKSTADGGWVRYADVLAALSRALNGVDERAGEVLEGVTDGTWDFFQGADNADKAYFGVTAPSGDICQMSNAQAWRGKQTIANARFIAWCREGVPALLAQNAALRANTVQALDEADREYSRKTNDLIERHAEQLAALRAELDELAAQIAKGKRHD